MKFTHEVTRRFMVVAADVAETEVIEVQRFQHFHVGPVKTGRFEKRPR